MGYRVSTLHLFTEGLQARLRLFAHTQKGGGEQEAEKNVLTSLEKINAKRIEKEHIITEQ